MADWSEVSRSHQERVLLHLDGAPDMKFDKGVVSPSQAEIILRDGEPRSVLVMGPQISGTGVGQGGMCVYSYSAVDAFSLPDWLREIVDEVCPRG